MSRLTRLARRFGFESTVPVALVQDWWQAPTEESVTLAPRYGAAGAHVDRHGRIQINGSSWTLEWTVAGGARWLWPPTADRVTQQLVSPAVVETTMRTPAGSVIQRVAAAVVDAKPVLIAEIENLGDVAIAVGVVARPFTLEARGSMGRVEVTGDRMRLDGGRTIHFPRSPGATCVAEGGDGDLLQNLPDPDAGAEPKTTQCRSGGAQAAAVWPLAHTATLRLVVELAGPVDPAAPVPTIADVQSGWSSHLSSGMSVGISDTDMDQSLATATRTLLTGWPGPAELPAAITALAELGHGADADRLFSGLGEVDDEAALVAAVARWAQLGDPFGQLDVLDASIAAVARAIHVLASASPLEGPGWLGEALVALADRFRMIEQPDVADRVADIELAGRVAGPAPVLDDVYDGYGLSDIAGAARFVLGLRSRLIAETPDGIDLLSTVPESWRGRSIEVLRAPVGAGRLSFGLRWHGARPALLWELEPEAGRDASMSLRVGGIDADFLTQDPTGEALLADPGWPRR